MTTRDAQLHATFRETAGWFLLLTGSILLAVDIIRLTITGVAVAAVVCLTIAAWMLDGFRRESSGTDITPHPDALDSLDPAERAPRQENQK